MIQFILRHTTIISVAVLLSRVSMFDMSCPFPMYNIVLPWALALATSMSCQSDVVVCGPLFVVMCHCMLAHCNAVPFVLSSLFVLSKFLLYL